MFEWEERPLLPDFFTELGRIDGVRRCGAIGLERGDCQMLARYNVYCYYHDKMFNGLLEPEEDTRSSYPVLPLPRNGYLLHQVGKKAA